MVLTRVTLGWAVVMLSLTGCMVGSDSAPPPGGNGSGTSSDASATASTPPCAAAGPELDLGALAYDSSPRTHVQTRAGWYRISASGFPHGGLLEPKVGRTTVVWGPATAPPTYDPGPASVGGAVGKVDVVEGSQAWVQLPAGTWWFLNSNGVRLALQGCPPATATTVPS